MAKGSRRQRDFPTSTQSLASLLALPRPYRPVWPVSSLPSPQEVLPYVQDRRTFTPDAGSIRASAVQRSASRLVAVPFSSPAVAAFGDPSLVGICARRKVRKEVLHALKRTKKGARGKKHRNIWSDYKC